MLKVGLTGGLACGKSFVARELEVLGCYVIHADALGHAVLARGGEAFEPVVASFGTEILDSDGAIVRARLAAIAFSDPEKLATLNGIVHPAVRRREDALIAEIARSEPSAIAVVEAAILIEAGLRERFDAMVLVACGEARQVERALARDPKATREDVLRRMQRQMPLAEKRRFADFVIDSSGTQEETLRQTRELYFSLLQRAAQIGVADLSK